MIRRICLFVLTSLPPISVAVAVDCDMQRTTIHSDPARTAIYAAPSGIASLYYKAKMAVNTDGSSRSYHPSDPRGKGEALNNIANAISAIYDPQGKKLDCSPRSGPCFETYIHTFEKARDAQWKPEGAYRVATDGMIPWEMDKKLGWKVPCTIQSGVNAGHFVSQTAFAVDNNKPECDQDRYLDSLMYNAIVLPRNIGWVSQGHKPREGDLVAVRNMANGRIEFAIVGDRGPARDLGEGTVKLTANLQGRTLAGNETYTEIKKLSLSKVQYVVFAGENIRKRSPGSFTQIDVDRVGKEIFDRWGGVERLNACQSR